MSERWQLWIVGLEGRVSPSLCTWPANRRGGVEELWFELIEGEDGDLRLED